MRFMYIVTSPQSEQGPTPALAEAMGKLADREIKAGRMLDMRRADADCDGRRAGQDQRTASSA